MLSGGCLCGQIRYRASGLPYHAGYCHCVTCRRAAGAPVAAWFSNKLVDLQITGSPARYRSSDHGERLFCAACGTQLFFDDSRYPDELDISIASLDEPERVPPEFHLFASRRIPWVQFDDALPSYAETRDSPKL